VVTGNREAMKAVLSGETPKQTPQWLMGFMNAEFARKAVPEGCHYDGYSEYPEWGAYPFCPMGEDRLSHEKAFNEFIDRVAFPVGWGANAAFGHCGPGEFNKTVIGKADGILTVEYETGAKKEIRANPYNVRTYYLPVEDERDLERLVLPDAADPCRYAGAAEDIKWAKARGLWTVCWLNGFFSGVHYFLREYSLFLADLLLEPEFSSKLIKTVGDWNLRAAEALCLSGADCIGLCDDLGSGNSLLFHPDIYRRFFKDWHADLCDLAHGYGAAVHLHSHGAVMPILKDLVETGIDILNPFDPEEGMEIKEARRIAGRKLVICGGLCKGFFNLDEASQKTVLRETVERGRASGPFILMDAGGIPENANVGSVRAFLGMSRDVRSG